MNTDQSSDNKSAELQTEIDRLAEKLRVLPMQVGLRSKDDLDVYVDDDGSYHFTFYERGQLGFDRVGSLDDLLYWYSSIVTRQAAKSVADRKERFSYEYQVLSDFSTDWAKRNVRDTAAFFRRISQPEDLDLLPDIGEPL